jgi:hypothetical protein
MTDTNKTPNCNMREALMSYLYDEATPEETRLVESHIKECASCSRELNEFRQLRARLQQWELTDLPVVRVNLPDPAKSFLSVFKELFALTPVWAKACGALAAAMLVLAILGTDVSIGQNGFALRMGFLGIGNRSTAGQTSPNGQPGVVQAALTKDQVAGMINQAILDNEKQQKQALETQITAIEAQLQHAHSADFARLSASVQQQRERIKGLEQDIDRREGLDLTDILFSSNSGGDSSAGESGGAQGGR